MPILEWNFFSYQNLMKEGFKSGNWLIFVWEKNGKTVTHGLCLATKNFRGTYTNFKEYAIFCYCKCLEHCSISSRCITKLTMLYHVNKPISLETQISTLRGCSLP